MKLLTLLLLTVLLGFVIKSNEAKAATTDNGFEYVCDYYYNTATIYGYTGNESNIVFPSEIDGCKVTKILAPDDGWGKYYRLLDNYNTVVSIVIPDTLEEIGKEAFFRCINLKSVVMSKNLRKLGDEAFRECGSLETIVLPASIEELGELAFYYCTNLKTVTLPSKSKITLMPRAVFNNCSSLEQINIPNNVKKIDRSAFYGCSSLTSIDIPSSVIEIRSQAFDECTNLSEIKLNEGLEIIENMVFYNTAIKKMDIPSTVTELGSSAFAACENLSIVSCGSNLNVIGESVFKDCINLIEVELNEGLTLLSKSSFQNTAITTIVIPSTVEKIESYAFKDCSSLKNAIFLGTPKMDGFTSGMRTTLYKAIISPAVFELVQAEFLRRNNSSSKHSGVSIFSSKIKCGDCDSWFGSKIWHSNDKYRKVIFQCNNKFKGKCKCTSPHLSEQQIKDIFVSAFNKLMPNKNEIIDNMDIIIQTICDNKSFEEQARGLEDEIAILVQMTQDLISRNAHVALNQEEYQKRYEGMIEKYETKKGEYDDLQTKINKRNAKAEILRRYTSCLTEQNDTIIEFDGSLWSGLVDCVTAYSKEDIRVTFKDGMEIIA